MDEKMKKLIEGIYESLTDEQKEKAKACKTTEELMEFAGNEGLELPDEMLDSVSGGCGSSSIPQAELDLCSPYCDLCTDLTPDKVWCVLG